MSEFYDLTKDPRELTNLWNSSDLDAAALERDPDRRFELLEDIERRLFTRHLPMIPICQVVDVHMYDPTRVTGLSDHPRQVQRLWRIDVGDDPTGGSGP